MHLTGNWVLALVTDKGWLRERSHPDTAHVVSQHTPRGQDRRVV